MSTNPEAITPETVYLSRNDAQLHQPSTLPAEPRRRTTSRGLQRRVAQSNGHAVVRSADVAAEGRVAVQKTREVQNLIQHAMVGHAMAANLAHTLAGGDPFLADDLNGIVAVGRMSMIQIVADFTDRARTL